MKGGGCRAAGGGCRRMILICDTLYHHLIQIALHFHYDILCEYLIIAQAGTA